MSQIKELIIHFSKLKQLKYINNLLNWDLQVYMPDGSNKGRAELISLVGELVHKKLISNKTETLISEAEQKKDLSLIDAAILREAKREYQKAIKIPTDLVVEIAKNASLGHKAWEKARKKSDFSIFRPYLTKMIDLQKQYADLINIGENRYDSLLDDYEPGATKKWLSSLFNNLAPQLQTILKKLETSGEEPDSSILENVYDAKKQWEFSNSVIEKLGFDFSIGRQDKSVHPFTTAVASEDVRITTRIIENFLPAGLFGTIHECGHALYDMGFMEEIHGTNLADGSSLGIHESQSRMYENFVGRSKEFWKYWYPRLKNLFPENLGDVALNHFYKAINTVKPSLIRVEADEITYSLHIILRFEIESLIFEDLIEVEELPQVWDEKMTELLNITPPNDAKGILQDVHWSGGAFGYFPTYTLGNLYAAQIYNDALTKNPNMPFEFTSGNFNTLLQYLRENVHQYGSIFHPRDLIHKITGEALNPEYFITYLEEKFYPIYRV
ncbi:MAG: Carboxypeptidase 1 [Promethearchaeota archaeon]|nr:MAG: Carboxypeptidase 1 [Candidatus Lokiarchaeota archaeon]